MMPNRSTDILFQLMKTLEKSEKRHFKLYIKRSSGNEDLKIVRLFDALDKMNDYDEPTLLKKLPGVEKARLNLTSRRLTVAWREQATSPDHFIGELERIEVQSGDQAVLCRVSIGATQAASGEVDGRAVVQRADEALYLAKARGRDRFFSFEMQQDSIDQAPQAATSGNSAA